MHAWLFPVERRAAEKFLIKMEIFREFPREFSGELRGQGNLLPGGPSTGGRIAPGGVHYG